MRNTSEPRPKPQKGNHFPPQWRSRARLGMWSGRGGQGMNNMKVRSQGGKWSRPLDKVQRSAKLWILLSLVVWRGTIKSFWSQSNVGEHQLHGTWAGQIFDLVHVPGLREIMTDESGRRKVMMWGWSWGWGWWGWFDLSRSRPGSFERIKIYHLFFANESACRESICKIFTQIKPVVFPPLLSFHRLPTHMKQIWCNKIALEPEVPQLANVRHCHRW